MDRELAIQIIVDAIIIAVALFIIVLVRKWV